MRPSILAQFHGYPLPLEVNPTPEIVQACDDAMNELRVLWLNALHPGWTRCKTLPAEDFIDGLGW